MWLQRFKRICLLFFSVMVLFQANCFAEVVEVQLHDTMSVDDMGVAINNVLAVAKADLQFTSVQSYGESDDYYLYGYNSNQPPDGSAVLVFANKSGKIAKMKFMSTQQGQKNTAHAIIATLMNLGINPDEATQMIKTVTSKETPEIWCRVPKAKRVFVLTFEFESGVGIYTLTARTYVED